MKTIIRRINRNMSVGSATVLISSSLLIGMLLGIVRTKLINADFNNFSTGAYFAAFKLPEFIFFTLSAGALSVAFIPVLTDKLSKENRQKAWYLVSSVLNSVAFFMLIICLIMVIFPHPILKYLIAPGFAQGWEAEAGRLDLAAQIMRLAATGPLVFSVASILSSVQQVFSRFFFFAVAPIFYNLCIIASIYIFKDSMGVVSLGLGAAIGGLFSLLILGLGMNRLNFRHTWFIDLKDKAFLQVFKALPFRSFDQGVVYINSIVQTRIASSLSVHAITNFENALILYNAPITLLGVALGTATFPHFTKRLAQNRPDLFKKEFLDILRTVIWISIPVILVSYFCRDYMAKIIFTRDNSQIADIFGWLCLGIFFRTLYAIISRFYYAQKDTWTPLLITLLAFVVNAGLSWWLSKIFNVIAFGMATSAAAAIEIIFLVAIIIRRDRQLFNKDFVKKTLTILLVSLPTLGFAFLILYYLPYQSTDDGWQLLWKLALISSLTALVHFAVSYAFSIYEARRLMRYLQKMQRKLSHIFYEDK